jgi:type I restriction enzyme S subunit
MSGTVRLENLIEKAHVKRREFDCDDDLEAFGVSNSEGITRTAHRKSEDLGEYLVIEPGSFAYNPYRINVGSIGLTPANVTGVVSPAYVVFRVKKRELIPEVLLDFLKSSEGLRQINKLARGAVRKALRFEDLCEIEFPAIPYERQLEILKHKRGFNKQHGSLLFEITHQQSLLAKLKQAILQEAIQGKLTADWRAAHPEVEPASQLLLRIQTEKARLIAAKKLRPEKPLPKITPAEIPFEIPKGWEWCLLEELVLFTNGKAHEQIVDPKGRYVLVNSRFVSTGGVTKKFARAILTPISIGDLALVMSDVPDGRALGRCFLVDKDDYYTLNQRIGALRMLDQINPMFAFLVLDRNRHFLSFNDGKKQTNLMKREILSCPFPLPPLAEQAAIVERVEALMTTCRALEAEIEHARTHAAHLLQAVLKEAFAPASA